MFLDFLITTLVFVGLTHSLQYPHPPPPHTPPPPPTHTHPYTPTQTPTHSPTNWTRLRECLMYQCHTLRGFSKHLMYSCSRHAVADILKDVSAEQIVEVSKSDLDLYIEKCHNFHLTLNDSPLRKKRFAAIYPGKTKNDNNHTKGWLISSESHKEVG